MPFAVSDSLRNIHDNMFTTAGYEAFISITLDMGHIANALYMKPMPNTPARIPADAIKPTLMTLRETRWVGSEKAVTIKATDAVKY